MHGAEFRKMLFIACSAWPLAATAAPPNDAIYIHCRNAGGDFRLSELNRSVAQFSDRFQEYRTVCADCDILEWGNKILMKDGDKTVVRINRLSGDISIDRRDAREDASRYEIHSFHGTCQRGTMQVPNKAASTTARAF